ncbi:MAG: PHP domain-containing protein [bacterium]|nr:PHP domain-containing protein [bacterium]
MTNLEIAKLFSKVSAAYTIQDEKKYRFQIIAYDRAADTIKQTTSEIKDLWMEGKLGTLSGLGPSIRSHLEELFKTGRVKHFDDLLRGLPEAMFSFLDIPGFGPKKAYKLATILKIKDPETAIDNLEKAAMAGKIRVIEGFGEKSEGDILDGIVRFRAREAKLSRMTLPYAHQIAQKVIFYLGKSPDVIRAETLGSLRRMVATVGDIDIAVSTKNPKEVLNYFVKYPSKRVLEKGTATASIILESGVQIDLMVQSPQSYGALLQHFTGSKNHNIHLRELALKKGMSLSEYGIKTTGRTQNPKLKTQNYNSKLKIYEFSSEEKFYEALDLAWIPPELREDAGEIEASLEYKLPKLVELKDIKGDLHIHSSYNLKPSHDLGKNSMEEIVNKAKELGYEYTTFSEHNPSITNHTENEILSIMEKRNNKIEQIKKSTKSVRIINMLEVDVLANGKLSMTDDILQNLDGVIVSVHSSFNQLKKDMTARVINALKNPYARILGHPTGRLLERREGYELDWDEVFDFCLKHDKALEINAWPDRLDLPDVLVREAVKRGVKMVISTDAHAIKEMDLMFYGVAVARRGWAEKKDILNTMEYNDFVKWLHERK